ncbi:hypothetical protein B0H21DRAFT_243013 [Amylocystis lapponica]|nr:hypothetical protein B0H21DRAFT_243013 [Amylocystis lapponica]
MSPRKSDTAVDVCSNLLTVLQQMQDVLSVAPFVPYLGLALSSAMGVVDVVKQMNLNQSRAKGIAQRVKDLKKTVSHTRHDEMEPLLKENIDELKSTLEDIHCDIEKQTKKTRLYRLVHVASISKKLDEHLEMLEYARQKFEVSSLIAMQQRIEYHASQARSQLADMFRHIRTRVDGYFNNLKTLFSRNFGSRCQGPGDGNVTSQEEGKQCKTSHQRFQCLFHYPSLNTNATTAPLQVLRNGTKSGFVRAARTRSTNRKPSQGLSGFRGGVFGKSPQNSIAM